MHPAKEVNAMANFICMQRKKPQGCDDATAQERKSIVPEAPAVSQEEVLRAPHEWVGHCAAAYTCQSGEQLLITAKVCVVVCLTSPESR